MPETTITAVYQRLTPRSFWELQTVQQTERAEYLADLWRSKSYEFAPRLEIQTVTVPMTEVSVRYANWSYKIRILPTGPNLPTEVDNG